MSILMNICCVLISIVVTTPSITNVTHKRIYFILEDLGKTNKKAYSLALKFDDFLAKRHKSDYKLNDEINYADYIQCKKYFEVIPNLLKEIS